MPTNDPSPEEIAAAYNSLGRGPDTSGNVDPMLARYTNNAGTIDQKFVGTYNANTITQENGSAHYLAEGPTESSLLRFFTAFFSNNTLQPISHIIVAGPPSENGNSKFLNYFDPTQPEFRTTVGDFNIESLPITSTNPNDNDTIKDYKIKITHTKTREVKNIILHHATHWPDFGVPEFTDSDIRKLHDINKEVARNKEGLVIHCAAGLGRTGVMELALNNQHYQNGAPTIKESSALLEGLRSIRPGLVQTSDQFHYAISDLSMRLYLAHIAHLVAKIQYAAKNNPTNLNTILTSQEKYELIKFYQHNIEGLKEALGKGPSGQDIASAFSLMQMDSTLAQKVFEDNDLLDTMIAKRPDAIARILNLPANSNPETLKAMALAATIPEEIKTYIEKAKALNIIIEKHDHMPGHYYIFYPNDRLTIEPESHIKMLIDKELIKAAQNTRAFEKRPKDNVWAQREKSRQPHAEEETHQNLDSAKQTPQNPDQRSDEPSYSFRRR